jgi:glyoxylase-like metal-dependent hydrolase (beta-lactamase superfamily II)
MDLKQIADKIFCYTEPNFKANVYYIDDSKKVQIDAGAVLDKPVDILFLTHCHVDHILKAAEIKRKNPSCTIAASEEAAAHIKNMDEVTVANQVGINVERFRVDLVLGEGDKLYSGAYKFKVMKVPGHTSGDLVLYESTAEILFSGDCWFKGDDIGRWDLPTGNLRELKQSVARLKELKVKVLCSGHAY